MPSRSKSKRRIVSKKYASSSRHKASKRRLRHSTHSKLRFSRSVRKTSLEDRCYVILGKGFKSIRIKGNSTKKEAMEKLKNMGFSPSSYNLNPITNPNCKKTYKIKTIID
jgi:hypothetical protein